MTKLADRSKRSFSSGTRFRGLDYFVRKKVGHAELYDNGLKASVSGTRSYKVILFWGKDQKLKNLSSSCSCPNFMDGSLCKHIWAVILEMDNRAYYTRLPGFGLLHVLQGKDLELRLGVICASLNAESAPFADKFLDSPWLSQMKAVQNQTPRIVKTSQLYFTLNLRNTIRDKKLWINFHYGISKTENNPSEIRPAYIYDYDTHRIEDPIDRQTLKLLYSFNRGHNSYNRYRSDASSLSVDYSNIFEALYSLSNTGRFFEDVRTLEKALKGESNTPLTIDYGDKFFFELFVILENDHFKLQGRLRRSDEIISLSELRTYFDSGTFLAKNTFYRFDANPAAIPWVEALTKDPQKFLVPVNDAPLFLETVLNGATSIDLPPELSWPREKIKPKVNALFRTEIELSKKWIFLNLEFDYGRKAIPSSSPLKVFIDADKKIILERNIEFEKQAHDQIANLGANEPYGFQTDRVSFRIQANEFVHFVQKCLEFGWNVAAEGKQVRQAGEFNIKVTSNIDWFDLDAKVDFGGMQANLPALLLAIEKRDKFIVLGDGSMGMLPDEWLQKYSSLAALGNEVQGTLRFKSNQAVLLDAWIGEEKNIQIDAVFKNIREKIKRFDGIKEQKEPQSFTGKLRPYQRECLSWFDFLEDFNLGGILADDMGLGKTIQCLALFEKRRIQNQKEKKKDKNFQKLPSLIVAPKTLVFNWIDEAQKFTPKLKVLNYSGLERDRFFSDISNYDIIVTTYQTLRLDIEKIKEIEFDCAVIDEAQAIKNDDAQVTKATKLIKAKFRLAMTGTPVENSLADLFTISEFVNPGLLGKKAFDKLTIASEGSGPNEAALKNLSQALKPFILRRTKNQVLKDLPEKSEQVIHLELPHKQKKEYDALKNFLRISLDKKIKEDGYNKSQFQVLTALLRLRQAALHPGLIDIKRINESSAKLDALVEQLHEVTSEGHKALVFSQFTKFLSIVKIRLQKEGIKFQYLDGQTHNRKAIVSDFKTDKSCKVFLMSLKAGGVGLNLIEADYVFLLDPWWNPAVEAQAIDRVHRIGQKNKVFAYKFIAKDTVEEKILELQKSKKLLADAVISTDKGFLKNMTAQDLQMLLA